MLTNCQLIVVVSKRFHLMVSQSIVWYCMPTHLQCIKAVSLLLPCRRPVIPPVSQLIYTLHSTVQEKEQCTPIPKNTYTYTKYKQKQTRLDFFGQNCENTVFLLKNTFFVFVSDFYHNKGIASDACDKSIHKNPMKENCFWTDSDTGYYPAAQSLSLCRHFNCTICLY